MARLKPCPRCGAIFGCTCAAKARPRPDKAPAADRGYDHRWQKFRAVFLRRWIAAGRLCACGCGRVPEHVDHIAPATGPDDPRFYDETNLQALTAACHGRKTAREQRQNASKGCTSRVGG